MTAPEVQSETPFAVPPRVASPSRLLASALLHLLDRDEPPPARWRAEPFARAVASHRLSLEVMRATAELDTVATRWIDGSFRGAVAALGSDPLAAALAVRHLELNRGVSLPRWHVIVDRGAGPRVSHADAARWFG